MEKRWKVALPDGASVQRISTALNIHPALATVLVNRGISSFDTARSFFNPDLSELHDPFQMKDMDLAVDRIARAMRNRERIMVFGDYDVDGTTAIACMYGFLCEVYMSELVEFYVPHRNKEGYGISRKGIDTAKAHGCTLIIALDCGVKSVELIREAREMGIDFIVCDHHLPGPELPPAVAILNPKQADCPYPFKELCGCGVGFKLISALTVAQGLPPETPLRYLDLVATAIAADIVPMTGENRVLAFHGLKKVNEHPSTGIRALIDLSGYQRTMNISNLVFLIAPKVNAAGRMDHAHKAIRLFIEHDYDRAKAIAEDLQEKNAERRETDARMTEEALDMLRTDEKLQDRKSTVVYHPDWHKGVIGIVASRLIEHYYRPTVVLTKSGEVVSGSGRSIPGFNLHEGLDECSDLLLGFGGHYFAAGMTLDASRVEDFRNRFDEIVRERVTEDMFQPEIRIDSAIRFSAIDAKFFRVLCRMEPFGPDNMQPVFAAYGVGDTGRSAIVKEKHLRLAVSQDGITFTGIAYNMADRAPLLKSGPVDIVFTLDENDWNGHRSLQLKIIDVKPSEVRG
jgi:single-stranded-DNA-specific exonuclease